MSSRSRTDEESTSLLVPVFYLIPASELARSDKRETGDDDSEFQRADGMQPLRLQTVAWMVTLEFSCSDNGMVDSFAVVFFNDCFSASLAS